MQKVIAVVLVLVLIMGIVIGCSTPKKVDSSSVAMPFPSVQPTQSPLPLPTEKPAEYADEIYNLLTNTDVIADARQRVENKIANGSVPNVIRLEQKVKAKLGAEYNLCLELLDFTIDGVPEVVVSFSGINDMLFIVYDLFTGQHLFTLDFPYNRAIELYMGYDTDGNIKYIIGCKTIGGSGVGNYLYEVSVGCDGGITLEKKFLIGGDITPFSQMSFSEREPLIEDEFDYGTRKTNQSSYADYFLYMSRFELKSCYPTYIYSETSPYVYVYKNGTSFIALDDSGYGELCDNLNKWAKAGGVVGDTAPMPPKTTQQLFSFAKRDVQIPTSDKVSLSEQELQDLDGFLKMDKIAKILNENKNVQVGFLKKEDRELKILLTYPKTDENNYQMLYTQMFNVKSGKELFSQYGVLKILENTKQDTYLIYSSYYDNEKSLLVSEYTNPSGYGNVAACISFSTLDYNYAPGEAIFYGGWDESVVMTNGDVRVLQLYKNICRAKTLNECEEILGVEIDRTEFNVMDTRNEKMIKLNYNPTPLDFTGYGIVVQNADGTYSVAQNAG